MRFVLAGLLLAAVWWIFRRRVEDVPTSGSVEARQMGAPDESWDERHLVELRRAGIL